MNELENIPLRLELTKTGVALVIIDSPGDTMNTLKADFAARLAEVLDRIDDNPGVRAVVFASAKQDSFVAGADIQMLEGLETAEQATQLSRSGQAVLDRLERGPWPSVAAIHGACLGGGLEFALACRERIASSDPKTKLGLPEVQLGLLPGLGGTQRLPRLIGVQPALDLMLTGRHVDSKKARRLGIVDEVVPESILVNVALERALHLAAEPAKKTTLDALKGFFDKEELTELALAENPLGRRVLFDQAKRRLGSKTHGKYPAPERILSVVKLGLERGARAGMEAEAAAFGELCTSREAQHLIQIFLATQELKKDRGTTDTSVQARETKRVAVLGAGLMGAGIAQLSALSVELPVRLKDRDDASLTRGLSYVRSLLDEAVTRRRLTPIEAARVLSRITPTRDYSGFRAADLVIEAVYEDLDLKRHMLADVEAEGHPEAIFATNTSSLPIQAIAARARHPERVIGMHYFSPVHRMPLLEVVVTERTAAWVTATVVAFGKKQGKTVIVVHDGPGFYTSRILAPYLNEALYLLSEGVAIERIDRALVEHGFPVGPIALLDEIGIDVASKVAGTLLEAFGARLRPPDLTRKLLAAGRLGRKSSSGFYQYDEPSEANSKQGKRPVDASVYATLGIQPNREVDAAEIVERCLLSMVNEAARCLDEGILRNARDGDVGAIFGLGFPPYLGGPLRYADSAGAHALTTRLAHLQARHGERFEPAPGLKALAARGGKFHA